MSPDKKCANCSYSQSITRQGEIQKSLVCMRYPPTTAFVPAQNNFGQIGIQMLTANPTVNEDGHCGEWMPIPLAMM